MMKKMIDAMEMTWKEIEDLPKERTIVFVTVSPVEEHGRHLPLGTDVYESEKWIEAAACMLSGQLDDYYFVRLPFLPLGYGEFQGFPFNFYYKQSTVRQVVYETLATVASSGFEHIVVAGAHGDPKHQVALEEACLKINKKFGTKAISPMGAFFSYKELGLDIGLPAEVQTVLEECPHDYHAGWIETSNMLDINASLVHDVYKELNGIKIEIKEFFNPAKLSAKIAGQGHIGFPHYAAVELGKLLNHNTAAYLSKAVLAFVKREHYRRYEHGIFFKIPFLRTNFTRNALITAAAVLALGASITGWIIF